MTRFGPVQWISGASLLGMLVLAGCSSGTGDSSAVSSVSAADRAEAETTFRTRCAACHGTEGLGNGPAAVGLNPKPRNYTDRAWQSAVTNEEIEKAIVYGGAAVGKSPQMAANPDLQAKPGVVTALREKVRSFAR